MGEEKGGSRKDWGAYRYIRKPYEVAAIKWTGKNPEEVIDFLGGGIGDEKARGEE